MKPNYFRTFLKQNRSQFFFTLCLFVYGAKNASGQNLQFHKPRELGIATTNLIWSAANYTIQFQSPLIPKSGHTWKVPGLDNWNSSQYRPKTKTLSDITLLSTGALVGLSLISPNKNATWTRLGITAESVWISANVTHSIKLLAQRNRPYTQQSSFTYSKRDDVYSFFSGHSSLAAALVTSALLMRKDEPLSPNSKIWLIAGATTTAGITAVLRIRAGKHYPSDVLTGLLTGMGIAWLNYKIHEK